MTMLDLPLLVYILMQRATYFSVCIYLCVTHLIAPLQLLQLL